MFPLILKTVKRILDHDDLIVLLFSKFKLNEGFKSMVAACCDCQLFKCVTLRPSFNQTIGPRRELQSKIDLIFHEKQSTSVLEHIDVEFFNETISPLKNVDDWIQGFLQVGSCKGLKQLLNFFLDKFNDGQVIVKWTGQVETFVARRHCPSISKQRP